MIAKEKLVEGLVSQLQIKLGVASLPPEMCTNHFVLLDTLPILLGAYVGSFKDRLDLAVGIGLPLMMRLDMLMQRTVKRGDIVKFFWGGISLQFKNTDNLELISNLLPIMTFIPGENSFACPNMSCKPNPCMVATVQCCFVQGNLVCHLWTLD